MWRTKAFHGQVFWTFVLLKAVTRSIIEVFRDDADRGTVGPLSTSQFLGLVTGLVAVGMLMLLARRRELRTPPDRLSNPNPAD
jgi:phosphatidylglycerol:prolipoprotein diacylglycerol transferase